MWGFVISSAAFPQEIIQAVQQGNIEKVRELLHEDQERVNEKDRVNYTPLHWAAMMGNKEIAELLVSNGADINDTSNNQHLTPLQCGLMFSYGNDYKAIDFLLDENAKVELTGKEGAFNLHIASGSGYEPLAKILLKAGIDVNSSDKYGLTALHKAAWAGHEHITDLLLDLGAQLNVESIDGRRPITMAKEAGHEEIIHCLLSYGAENSPQRFPILRGDYVGMKKPGSAPEIFGRGIVSTENREHSTLVFSPDGKELFFTIQFRKPNGGFGQHMFVMTEKNGVWTKPQNPFNTSFRNSPGSFSSDGKRLYFHSIRPVNNGEQKRDTDIWYMEKDGMVWGNPVHLEAPVNSDKTDVGPRITPSGTLYFSSDRDGNNSDIYSAGVVNGQFMNPEKIKGFVNTKNYESVCYVAPDESFLIYYFIYPGKSFVPGLMISFRNTDGTWNRPVDMKEMLNLKGNDLLQANVSPDGKYLFILDDMDFYWVDAKILDTINPNKQK